MKLSIPGSEAVDEWIWQFSFLTWRAWVGRRFQSNQHESRITIQRRNRFLEVLHVLCGFLQSAVVILTTKKSPHSYLPLRRKNVLRNFAGDFFCILAMDRAVHCQL